VTCIDAPDEPLEAPEPDEPEVLLVAELPVPELPADNAGPMAVIVPGVVAPEGSTMVTASPLVTAGRSGPSGTVTIRFAAVT